MLVGFALSFVGCLCLYLASPHQRWRAEPLPRRARAAGVVCLAASLYAFTRELRAVPAVFAFVTAAMLMLVAVPYLGAALPRKRRGA